MFYLDTSCQKFIVVKEKKIVISNKSFKTALISIIDWEGERFCNNDWIGKEYSIMLKKMQMA